MDAQQNIVYIYSSYTDAQKRAVKKYQQSHAEQIKKQKREYRKTEAYKQYKRDYMRRYYASKKQNKSNNIEQNNLENKDQ
jgi:hypothetical protein